MVDTHCISVYAFVQNFSHSRCRRIQCVHFARCAAVWAGGICSGFSPFKKVLHHRNLSLTDLIAGPETGRSPGILGVKALGRQSWDSKLKPAGTLGFVVGLLPKALGTDSMHAEGVGPKSSLWVGETPKTPGVSLPLSASKEVLVCALLDEAPVHILASHRRALGRSSDNQRHPTKYSVAPFMMKKF